MPPPRIVMFYSWLSWLSIRIAAVNNESFKIFLDGTLDHALPCKKCYQIPFITFSEIFCAQTHGQTTTTATKTTSLAEVTNDVMNDVNNPTANERTSYSHYKPALSFGVRSRNVNVGLRDSVKPKAANKH